jgi:hypothetical protein
MASPPASSFADSISFLKASVLPALKLTQAGVSGIGVPGVEGAVNLIYELATLISVSSHPSRTSLSCHFIFTDDASQ